MIDKPKFTQVCGWTLVHGKRELNRFERDNYVSYCLCLKQKEFPMFVRWAFASDECVQTEQLTECDLEVLLLAVRKAKRIKKL